MKILIILGILFAFSQASDLMSKVTETIIVCVDEEGVNIEKVIQFVEKTTIPEDDEEFNAFFSCYYTKMGFLKDDDTLDLKQIQSSLPVWIKHDYPEADATKLSQDLLDHCEYVIEGHTGVKAGIKLRNCVKAYAKDQHK